MKFLGLVLATLAVCSADPKPGFLAISPLAYTSPIVAVPARFSSQYHSQDGLGQYSYGYSNDLSSKNEIRTLDGATVGSYSYVDAEGKLQNVHYRSDAVHGFRVAASNLPVPTSPEVNVPVPEPVQDTPEVVAARSAHMAAVEQAKNHIEAAHLAVKTIEPVVANPIAFRTAEIAVHQPLYSAPIVAAPSTYGYYFDNFHYPYVAQPYFRSVVHAPFVAKLEEAEESVPKQVEKVEEVVVESARSIPDIPVVVATKVSEVLDAKVKKPDFFVPKDTPEVAKARADHLDFVEKIKKSIASTH